MQIGIYDFGISKELLCIIKGVIFDFGIVVLCDTVFENENGATSK